MGLWTFDGPDTTDKVYDRSGQGNNGYFNGGATSSAKVIGKLGQALQFNGSSSYVDMGNDASLEVGLPFTISAWVKVPTSATAYYTLFTTDNGPEATGAFLQIEASTGRITTGYGDGLGGINFQRKIGASSVTTNTWRHVVGVVRGEDDMDIYVDGINDGGGYDVIGNGGAITHTAASARMGDDSIGNSFFPGALDDVRLYNRALTATEAKQLYKLGTVITRQ